MEHNKQIYYLTESNIQELIKNKIKKNDLKAYFDLILTEDSIDIYRELLELDNDNEFNVAMRDKYVYDLVIALLYEEALSLEDVKNIIVGYPLTYRSIFEKMVVLEYNLFALNVDDDSISEPEDLAEKRYVRDFIVKCYYNHPSLISYKDKDNFESEINNLDITIPQALENEGFNECSCIRINDQLAYIEKNNIALYSFLINYKTTNKEFIRKYYGIKNGYYIKKISELAQEKIELLDLKDIMFYNNYSLTPEDSLQTIREFLDTYRNLLINRTINY